MKNLYIIGASGFGREVLQWVKDINKIEKTWNIVGFLDTNPNALDGYLNEYSILGNEIDFEFKKDDYVVLAISNPKVKKQIVSQLSTKKINFATIIHPTAVISDYTKIGDGIIITAFAKISPNVKIGNFVTLLGSGVGHDANISDFCTITGNCSINGHVQLGEGVFIGSNSCIAPGKRVGEWAYVGMGSMVISNIKPNYKVMGNPAKRINL
jgi:sugar O-acyltransferase (sialic acid O-acetyltransferase NeuD family)